MAEKLENYDNQNLLEKDKASIGFAIAKAYEDIKDYLTSFKYYYNIISLIWQSSKKLH